MVGGGAAPGVARAGMFFLVSPRHGGGHPIWLLETGPMGVLDRSPVGIFATVTVLARVRDFLVFCVRGTSSFLAKLSSSSLTLLPNF